MPTIRIPNNEVDAFIEQMKASGADIKGIKIGEQPKATTPKKPRKKDLLPTVHVPPNAWLIGVETVSEANTRSKWGSVSRVMSQRTTVTRAMAPYWRVWGPIADVYRAGKPIRVKLARLGGRGLDRGNLWRALKAVEDAVALLLGCNDGDPRWQCEVEQFDNPKIGVRVILEIVAE